MKENLSKQPANVATAIALNESEQEQLHSFARSRSLPHSLVERARLVLLAEQAMTNQQITQEVNLTRF